MKKYFSYDYLKTSFIQNKQQAQAYNFSIW